MQGEDKRAKGEGQVKGYRVIRIKPEEARPWILKKHYAHRMPSVSYAFGLYHDDTLIGICTYGMPASNSLCEGICGKEYRNIVLEFNRLCLDENNKNEGSFLLGKTFKMLPKPMILVSYADTHQGHIGYIYQATNWIFTGTTKKRTDIFSEAGHSRHHCGDISKRQDRFPKHRYVYFIGSKRQRKEMKNALKYPILPYPKGESKRYDASTKIQVQQLMF